MRRGGSVLKATRIQGGGCISSLIDELEARVPIKCWNKNRIDGLLFLSTRHGKFWLDSTTCVACSVP